MNKVIDENYLQIQGWMRTKLDLKGNELLVFALIYGFSQDGESEFSGSRSYIAEWLGVSLPTVDKSLSILVEKGLIEKKTEVINNVTFNRYKISLGVVKNFYRGSKETLQGGSKETLHYNNIEDNNNYNYLERENREREKTSAYKLPSQKEIKEFAQVRGRLDLADKFYNYYSRMNWCDKFGSPIMDWRAKFVDWDLREPAPKKYELQKSEADMRAKMKDVDEIFIWGQEEMDRIIAENEM